MGINHFLTESETTQSTPDSPETRTYGWNVFAIDYGDHSILQPPCFNCQTLNCHFLCVAKTRLFSPRQLLFDGIFQRCHNVSRQKGEGAAYSVLPLPLLLLSLRARFSQSSLALIKASLGERSLMRKKPRLSLCLSHTREHVYTRTCAHTRVQYTWA